MNVDRIDAAIRECIAQCMGSKTPVSVAAAYLERLEADPSWTEEDIRAVRLGVGPTLVRLACGVTDGD